MNSKHKYGFIKENLILSISFIAFLLVFSISPYTKGLFFKADSYIYYLIFIVLFIATALFHWKKYSDLLSKNFLIVVLGILIPTMYFFSYQLNSVSKHLGITETVYWVTSVSVLLYILGVIYIQPKFKAWTWGTCWFTVSWIVALAFLAHLGLVTFEDVIIWDRFASVFQYPNTFASIVSAFVLAALYLLVKEKNKQVWFIYSLTVLPFLLSFLMTESRGGYLVFAVCWVLTLFFLKVKEQIVFIIYSAVAGVLSLITLTFYQSQIDNSSTVAGLLLVVGILAFTSFSYGITLIINRKILNWNKQEDNINTTKKLKLLIPLGFVVLLVVGALFVVNSYNIAFLPESLQERISNINLEQHSVQERFLFYKDSITILGDYFWFGGGGGAWESLFEQYKSLPYQSSQAHSFYMQTLMEVGIIGGIVVFLFFLFVMFQAVRILISKKLHQDKSTITVYFLILTTLMLHNFIDFNMSYATYHYFVMVILALLITEVNRINDKLVFKIPKLGLKLQQRVITTTLVITISIALLSGYKAYSLFKADRLLKEAGLGGDYQTLNQMVEEGLSLDPINPSLHIHKLVLLEFAKQNLSDRDYNLDIAQQYDNLLEIEPFNAFYYYQYGQFELENGSMDKGIELSKEAIQHAPWNPDFYQNYFDTVLKHIISTREDISEQDKANYVAGIKEELERFKDKLQTQESELPAGLNLTNPIIISPEIAITIAKAYYYTGQFEEGLEFMEKRFDIEEVDESFYIEAQLIKLLTLNQLGYNEEMEHILNSERGIQLNLRPTFEQINTEIEWKPFTN